MKNILNKVNIHFGTYLILFFALMAGYIKNMFIIFIIVIVHEMGHIFFLKVFKIPIEKVIIYPFGGLTIINSRLHERIYKNIIVSLGGIFFQIFLILLVKLLFWKGLILISTYDLYMKYNYLLIMFNIIPIIPLDGSKLVFAFLTKFFSYKTSYYVLGVISIVSLIGFIIYNFVFKINDLIIYLFFLEQMMEFIKNYKYMMNKFFLERVMYEHYYDGIISDCNDIFKLRIDKYYYFFEKGKVYNEKRYLKDRLF